jgi:hypothetical protein
VKNIVAQCATLNQKIQAMGQRHIRGFQIGVRKAAYYVFQLTQAMVPVDTGYLKSTGSIKFGGSGVQFSFMIGYGADYAIYVHERLDQYHEPPTAAKFVERPMRESRGVVNQMVIAAIRAGG